jgi:hypothetical protein
MRAIAIVGVVVSMTLGSPVVSAASPMASLKGTGNRATFAQASERAKTARLDLYVLYGPVLVHGTVREYPQTDALVQVYAHNKLIRTAHTNSHGRVSFLVPAATRLLLKVTANPGGVRRTGSTTLPSIPPGRRLEWTSRFCADIC